ncbi:MAG: hypothetical protein ACRC2M_21610, partial [Planktothrix sp.]
DTTSSRVLATITPQRRNFVKFSLLPIECLFFYQLLVNSNHRISQPSTVISYTHQIKNFVRLQ